MRQLLSIACLLLFHYMTFSQNWTLLSAPGSGRYDDIFFLDDNTGWACNSGGQSVKTTDGGASWAVHQVDENSYLRSIEFMDADTGFCGGLYGGAGLFRSTDGGVTWKNITPQIPDLTSGICGLSCPGGKVVYGCGVWSDPAYVIKSLDGGVTWEYLDMSPYAYALVDMHFISQDTGWVCGRAPNDSGGLILYTTDGGATWETVHNTQINHDYVWKLQRLDAQHWFASIEREPVAGAVTHMLKSVDGGLTWSAVLVKNTVERMQAIGFVTPLRGWAGDNKLFETKDGGLTWQNINGNNSIGSNFNRFVRMSANKAFLSGVHLHQFLDGAAAAPEPNLAGGDFHWLAVSPNPASSSVQIQITLKQRTQVMLRLYRFDGRYEEILWQGDQQPGDYILPIDLTHKASGTYIVYLKTHHGVQYEKLVKP